MRHPYICGACAAGEHEECWDADIVIHDIYDAPSHACECDEGPCAGEVSYACAEWLHNCPGCPCECHGDEKARAIWREAHQRYVKGLPGTAHADPTGG